MLGDELDALPARRRRHGARLSWAARLATPVARAEDAARTSPTACRARRARRRLVDAMDFTFLYDAKRRLLHIGYRRQRTDRLDAHHYDLLASEARLASFVAIAKGDVPEEHWLHLGRPIGRVGGGSALLSWSGTMFEYLMPPLLLREAPEHADRTSVRGRGRSQIAYAARARRPVGDLGVGILPRSTPTSNYQYRAFGVPDLGFKRGLEDDLVVAPYARAARAAVRAGRGDDESRAAGASSASWDATASTRRSTSRRARLPHGQRHVDRALVHGPPPGHDPGRRRQPAPRTSRWCAASTPTRVVQTTEAAASTSARHRRRP